MIKYKIILTGLIFLLISGFANLAAQGKIYEELYEQFGEIPEKMNSEDIKSYARSTKKIDKNHEFLLDNMMLEGRVLVPVGKRVKGKFVTLLYIEYDTKKDDEYFEFRFKTFNKKTGEIYMSSSHMLDIGKGGNTLYDGSYILEGNFWTVTQIEKEGGSEKVKRMRYEFGKYLAFDEHLD